MPKFYFTCGQIHSHKCPGTKAEIWDKDSLIEVEAPTEDDTVKFVYAMFGMRWANVYPESELPELLKFAKRGVVAKYDAI
jgi:hypothetical protein